MNHKLVIVMVGLPARGKSYICKKLCRYLNWLGYPTNVFNVGQTRRQGDHHHPADFFNPDNAESRRQREEFALKTVAALLEFLDESGQVAILDATNSTKERRKKLVKIFKERAVQLLFCESICNDPAILQRNIEMKLDGPDYKGQPRETSLQDFKKRIEHYEKTYETVSDDEYPGMSYIKIIDVGKKTETCNVDGYISSQCAFYLMQLHIEHRSIWITRHGESVYNVERRIGGDPPLTEEGVSFAECLAAFIPQSMEIWTSTLRRSVDTAQYFARDFVKKQFRQLNEIHAGDFEELSYDEIETLFPQESYKRSLNKIEYRYPGTGGESYMDVISRVQPIIVELERKKSNLLVITHTGVIRTLLAYFLGISLDSMVNIQIPKHHLYQLEPKPYGTKLTVFHYASGKIEKCTSLAHQSF